MKILVVCQFYYPEPLRIHEIAEGLVVKGNEVTVLTTYPNYPGGDTYPGYENKGVKREDINGVKVIRISSRPRKQGSINLGLSYFDFYLRANRFISHFDEEFDVVYSYQLSPVMQTIPAIKYARKHKVPLFTYCLDIWPESIRDVFPSDTSIFFKWVMKMSVSVYRDAYRLGLIGVTSQSFIDYFKDDLGMETDRIVYLPQHSGDVKGEQDFTSEENGCLDIFFMGNVGESQNFDMIIDAVGLIGDRKGFVLHVVGDGSVYQYVVDRVNGEGLSDKVVLYGRKPYSDMPKYYKMADVCLLPLTNTTKVGLTIPGKLQNYMAAGKMVIASIGGDAPRVIQEAQCGVCVEPDNARALADAILEVLENRDKYSECGNNARKYYLEHFTLEKHLEGLLAQMEKIITAK